MIRQAVLNDAEELAELIMQVERESPYMLYEADERKLSVEEQFRMIEHLTRKENSNIFVAVVDHRLVGYLFAIGGSTMKTKYGAHLVIGILKDYRGKGIGTALFEELDNWAKGKLHRLELTVITENNTGINLYEKAGFVKEGIKKHSLYMKDRYIDEFHMSKLMEGE